MSFPIASSSWRSAGATFWKTVYGCRAEKIDLIPHGVVDMPFIDSNFYKDQFGVEGKTVLLTFGLLSPNKGIEYRHRGDAGDSGAQPERRLHRARRDASASARAGRGSLPVETGATGGGAAASQRNVIFHNRFVTMEELKEYIGAADIYITPYLNEAQVTSGTLAYTFGAGKALISTPYWHAQELLADERGILVPFCESPAIAGGGESIPRRIRAHDRDAQAGVEAGREMIWPVVARRYMESFERARGKPERSLRGNVAVRKLENRHYPMPPLKLDHLFRMSDHTGIFQHAIYNVPNYHEGYCTDDNARAFIFTLLITWKRRTAASE